MTSTVPVAAAEGEVAVIDVEELTVKTAGAPPKLTRYVPPKLVPVMVTESPPAVLPEVVPIFISQTLYQWESNTRGATIIGAVGAGGIGLKLWEAMRTNSNWANVFYMVLLTLLVVFIFDNISNFLRRRLGRTLYDYNRLQAAQG